MKTSELLAFATIPIAASLGWMLRLDVANFSGADVYVALICSSIGWFAFVGVMMSAWSLQDIKGWRRWCLHDDIAPAEFHYVNLAVYAFSIALASESSWVPLVMVLNGSLPLFNMWFDAMKLRRQRLQAQN